MHARVSVCARACVCVQGKERGVRNNREKKNKGRFCKPDLRKKVSTKTFAKEKAGQKRWG